MTNRLENKVLFRFIKVIYYISFIVTSFLFLSIGWSARPRQVIDNSASYFVCNNSDISGMSYSDQDRVMFDKIGVRAKSVDGIGLDYESDNSIKTFCSEDKKTLIRNRDTGEQREVHFNELKNYNIEANLDKIEYDFKLNYSYTNGWDEVISWWVLGIGGSFALITTIRNVILYIFYNESFWPFLK